MDRAAEIEELAVTIAHSVTSSPSKTLPGSDIGQIIQNQWPKISFLSLGVANLREFIGKYVPSVTQVAWSGGDPVYGTGLDIPTIASVPIKETAMAPLQAPVQHHSTGEGWRVWVSPSSPYVIAVDRETLAVRVTLPGQSNEFEAELRPASATFHRQMAKKFLQAVQDGIPAELKDGLDQLASDPDPQWFRRWTSYIRERLPEINERWLEHRRKSLLQELGRNLKDVGLENANVDRAVQNVLALDSPRRSLQTLTNPKLKGAAGRSVDEPDLIQIVQAVVGRMTDADLRSLPLPVGLVVDVMKETLSH